ncbi:TetR/AcrR family transcriptional regulator [Nocardioides sp. NPDC087217]|uniref:TetR/AcrR family transcriptional regulator n=1 Tax=Nocardioides sp. NPDC087217 TaxID=3364335 RepID=UPI00380D75AC
MIETAGRRFKADGIDGSGIATLVADAGLTNGAFYGHFASKGDLVASVVADQLAAQVAWVNALPAGLDSIGQLLSEYLSPAHRDDRAGGCPSAALLDEIGRCDDVTKQAYTAGAQDLIDAIARHLDPGDPEAAHQRAIGLFTLLVGALQAARAVSDAELSDQILATAYSNAMTIVGATQRAGSQTTQEQK